MEGKEREGGRESERDRAREREREREVEIKLREVTRMELETDWLICYESLNCYCISNPFNDEFVINTSFSLQATVGIWNAGKNNMGFGFNRETWNVIKGCAEVGII